MIKRIVLTVFILLLAAVAIIGFTVLRPGKATTVEDRVTLLQPDMEVFTPTGEGPFPFVLLIHGCGGLVGTQGEKDVMLNYAKVAQDAGYIAVIIDSFKPRNIDFKEAISSVCSGMKLRGRERAGDILAGYSYAQNLPNASDAGHTIAGWSHGGWALMELMTMDLVSSWPTALKQPSPTSLDGLTSIYLTYPYCGFPATSHKKAWLQKPPTSIVVAQHDIVVQMGQCIKSFKKMHADGVTLEVEVLLGVTHAFDESDQTEGSAFVYDEANAQKALARFSSYLRDIKVGAEFPNPDRVFIDVEEVAPT